MKLKDIKPVPTKKKEGSRATDVNMVPVGDAGERRSPRQPALSGPSYFPEKGGARYEVQAGGETKKVCRSANECIAAAKEVASYMGSAHTIKALEIQPKTYKSKVLFETKGRVGTKVTDVNMVPVGDAVKPNLQTPEGRLAYYQLMHADAMRIYKKGGDLDFSKAEAKQLLMHMANQLEKAEREVSAKRGKATDSTALSRGETQTLRDVLVLGRAMDAASEELQTAQEWEKEFWSQLKEGKKKANKYGVLSKKDAEALIAKLKVTVREYANAFLRVSPAERKSVSLPSSIELRRYIDQL